MNLSEQKIKYELNYVGDSSTVKFNYLYPKHLYRQHQSLFCTICEQRFRTKNSLSRHKSSRKHLRYLNQNRIMETNRQCLTPFASNQLISPFTTELLPNGLMQAIIDDLRPQLHNKDNFFSDINLLDEDDLDIFSAQSVKIANDKENHDAYKSKQAQYRQIPSTYPCAECFQFLDSQELFDQHMREKHLKLPQQKYISFS